MAIPLELFSQRLAESGLFEPGDLIQIASEIPAEQKGDSNALASELVRRQRLTPYQARQIESGQGSSLILGNYLVLDLLGQGGMGTVLKAQHRRMKRIVALKVMSPGIVATPEALRRFQREVETVARLEHPNIVTAHDADEVNGTRFLVMQFVDGIDLAALVRQRGPLPVAQALSCIEQAASGLEFAHRNGVIHRDIKPANLMIDRNGIVQILDLGLARLFAADNEGSAITASGAVMGTIDYMAPEQALSTNSADQRSDIYSLGMTLWYLLTGQPAFEGDSLFARLLAHREAPLPSLLAIRTDVPVEVERLFRRMVAKRPEDRPQSMSEVRTETVQCRIACNDDSAMDLVLSPSGERWTADQTRSATPGAVTAVAVTTAVDAGSLRRRRNKALRATILAGLLAAAALWTFFSRARETRRESSSSAAVSVAAAAAPAPSSPLPAGRPAIRGVTMGGRDKIVVPTVIGTRDLTPPFTIELFCTPIELQKTAHVGLVDFESQAVLRIGSGSNKYYFQTLHDNRKLKLETPATAVVGRRDHVAAISANGRIRVYVNGVQAVDAEDLTGPPAAVADALEAGKAFHGTIEELRVSLSERYSGDFTPSEWLQPDSRTLLLFHCDESSGNLLNDSSGNRNHGLIEGTGWSWSAASRDEPPNRSGDQK